MNILVQIVVGILVRVFSDDLKSYISKICIILLRVSANRLNEKYAASFYEEWLSHLNETPELLGKLWHAISVFAWGTYAIRMELGSSKAKFESYLRIKRAFDLFFAILVLLPLIPTVLVTSTLIRRDGGPGFFRQEKVGQNGKTFRCWKIRTMVVDADERLQSHLEKDPNARDEWFSSRALQKDPRITPFGSFLRRTSLDEIPLLINVLKGEMSIVGPRPVTPAQIEQYKQDAEAYKAFKPGITGFWQASEKWRSIGERIEMDKEYLKKASLWEDIKVIFSTAKHPFVTKTDS